MNWPGIPDRENVLSGRSLRFLLVAEIRRRQVMTVAEMVEVLARDGHELPGRPSKVISDALRWELARGRVKRLGRGVYGHSRIPRSTARRIDLFAGLCRAWITASKLGHQPPRTPSTPPHRRFSQTWVPEDPSRPPWVDLKWLWAV